MLALILVFGSPADGLFGIVMVINSLIGIVQELRAKRTLDRLAVLSAPSRGSVRDGEVARDRGRRRSCSTTCSSCAPATRSRPTAW